MTEEKTSNGARRAGAQDPASANAPVASRSAVGKPRVRRARTGDVAPASTAKGIGAYVASEATGSAQDAKVAAVQDIVQHARNGDMGALADSLGAILAGSSPDDAQVLRAALLEGGAASVLPRGPDDELAPDWREGGYPYKNLMTRRNYEKSKYRLQVELLKLQAWVKATGQGYRARTWQSICRRVWLQSICPIVFRNFGALLTRAGSCSSPVNVPASRRARTS